jgi:hypothetical protein
MDDKLRERFWKEFYIQTQTESKEVAFANPADVANALISSRNWYGTISEELVSIEEKLAIHKDEIRTVRRRIQDWEVEVLATCGKMHTTAAKNQTTMEAFIWANAGIEIKHELRRLYDSLDVFLSGLAGLERDKAGAEGMRRAVEKTADWLVQYINWQKFEMREF